ncbi:MAG TPA: AsmA family protein [Steroidobacteraceae bacterium]|nr:AsmA family protein [Steroidobacteraceae bacterium]
MRIGRWILGIVAALVLLAVLTVVAVTMFVDPNRFRGQVESAVARATGQPFKIVGDLEISWYPWLALRMGPSQFGKAVGSSEPPIVEWQRARVGAKLIPLTQGQLIIDRIRLEGPKFHLIRRADGRSNWDDVIDSIRARAKPARPVPATESTPGPQIGGFEVRDGSLEYVDEGKQQRFAIEHWQLTVGEWHSGATFPVETAFTYTFDGESAAANAPGAVANGRATGAASKRNEAPAGGIARAAGRQGAGGAGLPPVVAKVEATARLHVSDDANDIDLFGLESSNQLTGGSFPSRGLPITLQVSRLAARLRPLDIAISEVSARVGEAKVTASIQAGETGPDKMLYVRGPVSVEVRSVRDFLAQIGVKKAPLPVDKSTIGPLSLSSMWEWKAGAITVNGIDLQLDETHFSGDLNRASGADPVWTFALHGDKIGLSRYVTLEETSKQPFELPLATLRALKMQGELTFDQAWLADAQMKNVRLRVELADGAVKQGQ